VSSFVCTTAAGWRLLLLVVVRVDIIIVVIITCLAVMEFATRWWVKAATSSDSLGICEPISRKNVRWWQGQINTKQQYCRTRRLRRPPQSARLWNALTDKKGGMFLCSFVKRYTRLQHTR
jgi:hypothetical protein